MQVEGQGLGWWTFHTMLQEVFSSSNNSPSPRTEEMVTLQYRRSALRCWDRPSLPAFLRSMDV